MLASLLLSANQFVSFDRLAGGLWQSPPPSAHSNLRTYATRLRDALGASLSASRLSSRRGGGYRITVHHGELDADRFADLAAQGRVALGVGEFAAAVSALRAALSLWRGQAGDDMPDGGPLQLRLAALNEERVAVVEDLIEARLALGEQGSLVSELRALVAEHPLRERPWGQLIRTLYLTGDPSAALVAFDRIRTMFGQELGIEPSLELQRLQLAILRREDDAFRRTASRTGARLRPLAHAG
ncbi:MAG TPA: AfsR/SARP family transcriptional regulator [Pilimelia sp.]|nr:AfsR/SARP family transcriptional regulator [Pilimelia sp.]